MASCKHFTVSEEDFLELVSQVYDAGLDASRWNTTLQSIANFFHAEQGNLRIIDEDTQNINYSYAYNRDPYWVQLYKDYFHQVDPWLEMARNSDIWIGCTNHILSDREYRHFEIYNDYIVPTNGHFGMGVLNNVSSELFAYLVLHKGYSRGEFSIESLNIFKKLVPHVNKSILIAQRMQQLELQGNTLKQALNQMNTAVLLVNEKRQLLFSNTAAETLLTQRKDISISDQGIRLSDSRYNQQLSELIINATTGKPNSLMAEAGGMHYQAAGSDIGGLSILVTPLNPEYSDFNLKGNRAALVILSDASNRTQPAQDMLMAIYRFTKAEARVVSLLCEGLTLNEICEQLRLTANTAKTHLKSAFQKTGTRRQAELINLINTGPAGIVVRNT